MTELPFDLSLPTIRAAQDHIAPHLIRTPTVAMEQETVRPLLPERARATLKLELFQQAGSFKARGAFLSLAKLNDRERERGVTAVSGGNHALAVAWAAKAAGISAKVAIPHYVDPVRIEGTRAYGAEVVLCDDIAHAFKAMEDLVEQEGRVMIHPFEGEGMALGSATCGQEFIDDVPDLDVVILPVGGGGLIAGMATAMKQAKPDLEIFGVEPEGADSMARSFAAGVPQQLESVDTIADSLGAPMALPNSFARTRAAVSEIVRVSDAALVDGMRALQRGLALMPEPACAASFAGLVGPLAHRCAGARVGILACGSNISPERFTRLLEDFPG